MRVEARVTRSDFSAGGKYRGRWANADPFGAHSTRNSWRLSSLAEIVSYSFFSTLGLHSQRAPINNVDPQPHQASCLPLPSGLHPPYAFPKLSDCAILCTPWFIPFISRYMFCMGSNHLDTNDRNWTAVRHQLGRCTDVLPARRQNVRDYHRG